MRSSAPGRVRMAARPGRRQPALRATAWNRAAGAGEAMGTIRRGRGGAGPRQRGRSLRAVAHAYTELAEIAAAVAAAVEREDRASGCWRRRRGRAAVGRPPGADRAPASRGRHRRMGDLGARGAGGGDRLRLSLGISLRSIRLTRRVGGACLPRKTPPVGSAGGETARIRPLRRSRRRGILSPSVGSGSVDGRLRDGRGFRNCVKGAALLSGSRDRRAPFGAALRAPDAGV